MPPAGVKKGTKRARQYDHIKESQLEQGKSEDRAEERSTTRSAERRADPSARRRLAQGAGSPIQ